MTLTDTPEIRQALDVNAPGDCTTPETQVRCALANAAQWFRDYEREHRAKGTPLGDQKALVNQARASVCEEAAELAERFEATASSAPGSLIPTVQLRALVEAVKRAGVLIDSALSSQMTLWARDRLGEAKAALTA